MFTKNRLSRRFFIGLGLSALTVAIGFPVSGNVKPRRPSPVRDVNIAVPAPVEFREDDRRGLLVKTWVNGVGPMIFAVDTGAGMTIISPRAAARAGVAVTDRTIFFQGASETGRTRGRLAGTTRLAIGGAANVLPNRGKVAVADVVPPDLDGILDPTEAFAPLGYVIDFPNTTLAAFDPGARPLARRSDVSIVGWMNETNGRRPVVRVNGRYDALIDTGARFGLALPAATARDLGVPPGSVREGTAVRDVTGGRMRVTRVRPISIRVDGLALDRIPTDILLDAGPNAPILLGRDALRPFRISFDPRRRTVEFENQ